MAGITANHVAAARALAVDAATGEVLGAMGSIGCRTILLRGPAMRRALYAGAARPYTDADLLVAPWDLSRAGAVLARLGFEMDYDDRDLLGAWEPHHQLWKRSELEIVELHWRLVGMSAEPREVWRVLASGTEPITVAGAVGEALDRPRLAMVAALHAGQHGAARRTPLADLGRALDRFPADVWSEARQLAAELGALDTFAAGLRLTASGRSAAATLRVAESRSAHHRLLSRGAPIGSVRLMEILDAPLTRRDRLRMVWESAFPSPAGMRERSALARRGAWGLLLAYPQRWLSVLRNLPSAIRAIRSARR